MRKTLTIAAAGFALAFAAFAYARRVDMPVTRAPAAPAGLEAGADATQAEAEREGRPSGLGFPITRALERVTKKPFGILITKANSPVQPERFSGYHVGVDFETFEDEQGTDIEIFAVCDGPLVEKRRATGYGGVAVQRCELDGETVTVVYGHLDPASVAASPGEAIARGARLGVLGEAGPETDGERKHLHLGVRRGADIDLRGYVRRASEIADWIDAREHFPRQ